MSYIVGGVLVLILARVLTHDPFDSIDWNDMDRYTDSLEDDQP